MATQERNQELVNLLEPDFLRNTFSHIVKGGFSYRAEMEFAGVDSSVTTVIADGPDDVTRILWYNALIAVSSGGATSAMGALTLSGADVLHNDGSNGLAIFVNADGSVTMQALLGAATYDVSLSLRWI